MPRVSITISGKNPQPYRFKLDRAEIEIGRASDNDIVVDCPSVSSHHATMKRVEGGYLLIDKGSTNGIKLDDNLMEIIDLYEGLDIRVGDVRFDYTLSDEENNDLDREEFVSQEKKKLPRAEPRRKPAQQRAPAARPHAIPVTSATQESNFPITMATIALALIAFIAGVSNSYKGQERKNGRANVSLFEDMQDGRPVMEVKEGE